MCLSCLKHTLDFYTTTTTTTTTTMTLIHAPLLSIKYSRQPVMGTGVAFNLRLVHPELDSLIQTTVVCTEVYFSGEAEDSVKLASKRIRAGELVSSLKIYQPSGERDSDYIEVATPPFYKTKCTLLLGELKATYQTRTRRGLCTVYTSDLFELLGTSSELVALQPNGFKLNTMEQSLLAVH